MLEDYLAEQDPSTEMVTFDRYFTVRWARAHHFHLLPTPRENMELTGEPGPLILSGVGA